MDGQFTRGSLLRLAGVAAVAVFVAIEDNLTRTV
jgi:hypothetical protein